MCSLRTLALVLLVLPMQAQAEEHPLVSAFAACVGRFSAEMEHAWLLNQSRAEELEQRRAQFIDLLEATVAPDRRRQAFHLRIDAKMAHASLLTAASFSRDPERSSWAIRRAQSEIDYCAGFLLES